MSAYLMSSSGFLFDACDLKTDDIDIVSIASSLAKQCRFHGNCKEFYSVAQHCVLLTDLVSNENKRWALLHDAAEAYISDLAAPIKHILPKYIEIEEKALKIIAKKFDLVYPIPDEVLEKDLVLRKAEMLSLFPKHSDWKNHVDFSDKQEFSVVPYASWQKAEVKFLEKFITLFGPDLSKYTTTNK